MTDTTDPNLALERRAGLPDALRVLLEEYPRAGWEDDPGYQGLIAFWLDRHMMFRRLTEAMREASEARLDGTSEPERYAAAMSRYGSMLVSQLHGHHQIEDMHYFPVLSGKDARIASGFELLDKDHHALDGHIARFTDTANAAIRASDGQTLPGLAKDATGAFHEEIARFETFLDRHLLDEEELVVPVILKYGASGL
ncbi:hemerythrin domain-containing protein [Tropicimonas sp. IMCC34011]|uniref:hemerythrin domain-containing protein n=1 Tax=Tropicimonas sp. IMCC34011 TaxID=2248759 RepID=UPI000E2727B8|nr:hemerythrin domain-containing protein [Tropicimonas sp. IMCC34011]